MNILNMAEISLSAFIVLPVREKILCLLFFGFLIIVINVFFVLPIIFNFKIIPMIENKIGQKLEFTLSSYNLYFFRSYFTRFIEISLYIFTKFLKIPKKMNPKYALAKVRYSREQFSKAEIFWSFFCICNYFFMIICFIMLYFYISKRIQFKK